MGLYCFTYEPIAKAHELALLQSATAVIGRALWGLLAALFDATIPWNTPVEEQTRALRMGKRWRRTSRRRQ